MTLLEASSILGLAGEFTALDFIGKLGAQLTYTGNVEQLLQAGDTIFHELERRESLKVELVAHVPTEIQSDQSHSLEEKFSFIIPSQELLMGIKGMTAAEDDQAIRINNIVSTIRQSPYLTADNVTLINMDKISYHVLGQENHQLWNILFKIIKKQNCSSIAKRECSLATIKILKMKQDPLLMSIFEMHSEEYIIDLILACSQLSPGITRAFKGNSDNKYTNLTFEFLIKSLLAAIEAPSKAKFICGLPGHHAEYDKPMGFCFINTIAVLSNFYKARNPHIVNVCLDLDVNLGNGLLDTTLAEDKSDNYKIIDISDSRVFPLTQHSQVDFQAVDHYISLLEIETTSQIDSLNRWKTYLFRDNEYTFYNLARARRAPGEKCHPALIFALEKIFSYFQQAATDNKEIVFNFSVGFDHHALEEAGCSDYRTATEQFRYPIYSSKVLMERREVRFTDTDMQYFYQELHKLCANFKPKGIIFNLEGGYTSAVNSRQIELFSRYFCALPSLAVNELKPEELATLHPLTEFLEPTTIPRDNFFSDDIVLEERENPVIASDISETPAFSATSSTEQASMRLPTLQQSSLQLLEQEMTTPAGVTSSIVSHVTLHSETTAGETDKSAVASLASSAPIQSIKPDVIDTILSVSKTLDDYIIKLAEIGICYSARPVLLSQSENEQLNFHYNSYTECPTNIVVISLRRNKLIKYFTFYNDVLIEIFPADYVYNKRYVTISKEELAVGTQIFYDGSTTYIVQNGLRCPVFHFNSKILTPPRVSTDTPTNPAGLPLRKPLQRERADRAEFLQSREIHPAKRKCPNTRLYSCAPFKSSAAHSMLPAEQQSLKQ